MPKYKHQYKRQYRHQYKQRYFSESRSLEKKTFIFFIIAFLYFLSLYFTDRANFWRWFYYGSIFMVVFITGTIIWIRFREQKKQEKLDSLISKIKEIGVEDDIQNFINRFGHENEKNNWNYRGYYFSWSRLNDFRKILKDKGIKVSPYDLKDVFVLLQYYIQNKEERLTRESMKVLVQEFSSLSSKEFEFLIYRLLEAKGYAVEHVGRIGDQGGDLIANKDQKRILIQVKRYLSWSVSNDAIQEAVAAKNHYNCNEAVVITTGNFTSAARALAKSNNVGLVSRKMLQEMLLEHLSENWN